MDTFFVAFYKTVDGKLEWQEFTIGTHEEALELQEILEQPGWVAQNVIHAPHLKWMM